MECITRHNHQQQYAEQARVLLEEKFDRMIAAKTDEVDYFAWDMRTDTRWTGQRSFSKHVAEAIVSYAMSAWLQDKLPERVQFYDALFTSSLAMATKNLFTKHAPKK